MANQRVSIEQAAFNAVRRWLVTGLPPYSFTKGTAGAPATETGVHVSDRWPAAGTLPALAVTIISAGPPAEESMQPEVTAHEVIHAAVTPAIHVPAVVDLPTSIAALNAARTSYEAHRGDTSAHVAVDTANALTAPAATNQTTAEALADDLLLKVTAHVLADAHATPDTKNGLGAQPQVTPGNVSSLVRATKAILNALNPHYVARVYVWRIAEIEQPAQLDVWARSDVARNDLMAQLSDLLHASPKDSAGFTSDDPVGEILFVPLADGWPGYAAAEFDKPSWSDTSDSTQTRTYRATYRGAIRTWRLVKSQSPRLTRAQLQATTGIANLATHPVTATTVWSANGPVDTYTP